MENRECFMKQQDVDFFIWQTADLQLQLIEDEEIAEGGEPNVIEEIKVNGTALTPVNKSVNIETATKTSELTNDGDGTSPFATETYVQQNGGKIDKIKVNGTEQTITNKAVDDSGNLTTTAL